MTARRMFNLISFLLIGIFLYFAVQEVFLPDWNEDGAEKMLSGFSYLEDNTVDAIFFGPSHVGKGISPMKIYEDTGIRTYNMATSGQSMATSYYLLDHALETQTPKAIFIDAGRFFGTDDTNPRIAGVYRYVMDNLYPSVTSLKMALDIEKMTGNTGTMSALIPMTLYHTRWTELTRKDFSVPKPRLYYSMGTYVMPDTAPIDDDVMTVYNAHIAQISDSESDYQTSFLDQSWEYFIRIYNLCKERGVELILIKVPTVRSPYDNGWNNVRSQVIVDVAKDLGLDFYDLNDLGICEPETDTSDGMHLNLRGAEKVSIWIGELLKKQFPDLDTSASATYDAALEIYKDVRSVAMLESEMDFAEYLVTLNEGKHRWSFAVVGCGGYFNWMTETDFQILEDIGLKEIDQSNEISTYAAIVSDGKTQYETVSDRYIKNTYSEYGRNVSLYSASKFDTAVEGRVTKITYNDSSFSAEEGLLFVVWDKESGVLIDSKSFKTRKAERTGEKGRGLLDNYETMICENE